VGWRWRRPVDFEVELVGVAPPPVFAGLVGADQGVFVGVVVGGSVPVGRVVTAADVATAHTQAEMHPPVSGA
jgi:hypothetical protein